MLQVGTYRTVRGELLHHRVDAATLPPVAHGHRSSATAPLAAYFSMELALDSAIPTYAGGLGAPAGPAQCSDA